MTCGAKCIIWRVATCYHDITCNHWQATVYFPRLCRIMLLQVEGGYFAIEDSMEDLAHMRKLFELEHEPSS